MKVKATMDDYEVFERDVVSDLISEDGQYTVLTLKGGNLYLKTNCVKSIEFTNT